MKTKTVSRRRYLTHIMLELSMGRELTAQQATLLANGMWTAYRSGGLDEAFQLEPAPKVKIKLKFALEIYWDARRAGMTEAQAAEKAAEQYGYDLDSVVRMAKRYKKYETLLPRFPEISSDWPGPPA